MQNELVSIITPSYNSSKYVKKTIESVLNQTYQNWEMIIVDDCSSDNSNEIINEYTKQDSRIKLINLSKNVGAAMAKNTGLHKAKGRFIAFIDSDDIWHEKKLETQINFMKINNYAISFTSYELINENSKIINKTIKAVNCLSMKDYVKNTAIGFSTSMIDKELIDFDFRFRNTRLAEDLSFWIDLLQKDFKAYGLNNILVQYRVHSKSLSANKLKSAKQILYSYLFIHNFGMLKSFYYFSFYTFNAIKKRFM